MRFVIGDQVPSYCIAILSGAIWERDAPRPESVLTNHDAPGCYVIILKCSTCKNS